MLDDTQDSSSARKLVKTILLVEDDPGNSELLLAALSLEPHYHVLHVTTSSEAVAAVTHVKPNLFLLDYWLPGSMNGIALYDQLHSLFEDVPAIVLTASYAQHAQEIQQRHIFGLEKPFDLTDLLALIAQALTSQHSCTKITKV